MNDIKDKKNWHEINNILNNFLKKGNKYSYIERNKKKLKTMNAYNPQKLWVLLEFKVDPSTYIQFNRIDVGLLMFKKIENSSHTSSCSK